MTLFSEVDQVLQEHFVKQNVPNSSFHLISDIYCAKKFYILSRYTLVAPTVTKAALLEGELVGTL